MAPRRMSLKEYRAWSRDPRRFDASTKSFHTNGFQRTKNVLEGDANKNSVARWKSFGARHGASQKKNPTYRRAIALRNWGFNVSIPKKVGA